MAEKKYYRIKNYSNHGEMAISHKVFEEIALNAVENVKGAKIYHGRSNKVKGLNLYRPIVCEIKKDNEINLRVDISLKKGVDLKSTCEKIKEEINDAILLAVESVRVNTVINIAAIDD